MKDSGSIWTRQLTVEAVPQEGLHIDMSADIGVRAAIAKTAGLRDLPRLTASFDVTRKGRDGLHVTGEVSADIGQNCVVTLEPIEQTIIEPVDLVFVPEAGIADENESGETSIDLSEIEPPEPLAGGVVDLGAIATEYLLLGIDPFPRKQGVAFEPVVAGDPAANPFAALAALKKRQGSESE